MTLEFYLLRQLLVGLTFSVGGMVFIAIPGILVSAVQKLAGVGIGAILGFIPLVLIDLLPSLIPIGYLLALVATYGRLAADNEWTAIRMAGIHPWRVVRPALLLALVLSGGLYWLVTEVSPQSYFKKSSYAKNSAMRMLRTLNPGRTELKYRGFYLSARERDPEDRFRFEQVFIHVPVANSGSSQTLFAQTARFTVDGSNLLIDLTWPRWIDREYDTRLGRAQLECNLDQLFNTGVSQRERWKFQASGELRQRIDRTQALLASAGPDALAGMSEGDGVVPLKDLYEALYELHAREAMALTCVMFFLLGVPTGLLLRRGSQLGALAAAVGYALAYYLLSMRLGKGLALASSVPQWLAAWGTTMLGSVIGLGLSWRALRR